MSKKQKKFTVGIIGSGRFGEATAFILAQNTSIQDITIYTRTKHKAQKANSSGKYRYFNQSYHPKIKYSHIPEEIINTKTDIIFSVLGAQQTVLVVQQYFADLILHHQDHIQGYFCGTKGITTQSQEPISQALRPILGDRFIDSKYGYYYGPMFAQDVMNNAPLNVGLSAFHDAVLDLGSSIFQTQKIHIPNNFKNKNVLGVEYIAAFKNIAAIASGMCYELEGISTTSIIIPLIVNEIRFLLSHLGIKKLDEIFALGSPSMNDLYMTCYSSESRNFQAGVKTVKISQSTGLHNIENLEQLKTGIAEGVHTIHAFYQMAQALHINIAKDMPICNDVYQVLHNGKSPQKQLEIILQKLDL